MANGDYHDLLRHERAVALVKREILDLLTSLKERGAETAVIDDALRATLAGCGA